nr:417_t:CDS:2 [Entrophospora candida]
MNLSLASILYREGFDSLVQRGNHVKPDDQPIQTTPENIPTQRYRLKLKYSDNRPVLEQMKCVNKGSQTSLYESKGVLEINSE